MPSNDSKQQAKPSTGQIVMSVMAAFLGVQNDKNRQRDFAGGNIKIYIAVGIVVTIGLVLGLMMLVKLVLS